MALVVIVIVFAYLMYSVALMVHQNVFGKVYATPDCAFRSMGFFAVTFYTSGLLTFSISYFFSPHLRFRRWMEERA